MRVVPSSVVLSGCFLVACAAAPMPEGEGRGVIAFDPAPPAGAERFERPSFSVGDRYTLLRGGQARQEFAIVQVDEHGVVLQDAAGHRLVRDADLGIVGEWGPDGEPVHLLTPADARFHWPLWVGKRWRCEYVDRRPDAQPMTLEVGYHVEEQDTIAVPGGTFETLRIVRVATLKVAGETFFDRTSVSWYAPAIGLEVRQLLGDTAFELVEWTRADAAR